MHKLKASNTLPGQQVPQSHTQGHGRKDYVQSHASGQTYDQYHHTDSYNQYSSFIVRMLNNQQQYQARHYTQSQRTGHLVK